MTMFKRASLVVAMVSVVLLAAPAWASAAKREHEDLIRACIRQEEARRGLPRGLLLAIAKTESGLNWRALNRNRDGTYDIGVMQINSRHLPRLARYGITLDKLWHPCTNVSVGAYILHEFIAQHGLNWMAVAAYNTGSPHRKPQAARRYVSQVWKYYMPLAYGVADSAQGGSS